MGPYDYNPYMRTQNQNTQYVSPYNAQYPQNQYMYQQPMQQSMQQPMQQMSQMQPQMQRPIYLPGRLINDVAEIQINDVPTDGTIAFFPKSDGSAIYAKAWNNDGTIRTIIFSPQTEEQPVPQTDFSALQEQLNRIEKAVSRQNNNRKGGSSNESNRNANQSANAE